jgi:hypothetical protein
MIEDNSYNWNFDKKIRIIYHFDNPNCTKCLCPKCGSSFKRKFIFFNLMPIKKYKGCINYNCENFYKRN